MKNFSILALGALFAFSGVLTAPVPGQLDERALKVVTETETVTRIKVIGATKTTWIDPPSQTSETKSTTTTKSSTTTSTTTTTTTSAAKEEKKEKEEEKKQEPTPTPTPTPNPEPTPTHAPEKIVDVDLPKPTPPPSPTPPPPPPPPPPVEESKDEGNGGEIWEGEATYFDPGQGSCGETNGPGDMIAAISHLMFDPHTPNGNPNLNTLCGKKATCTRDGKTWITVRATDRCPVCAYGDMDLSPAAYAAIGGTISEGRFAIKCHWV